MAEQTDRDALAKVLLAATWPDGDGQGLPGRTISQILADAFLDSDWLAEHDRQVQAKTLRDAGAACRRMADQAEVDAGGKLDRWDAFMEAEDWMTMRADRIEGADTGADQ